ncbi:flagellar biosynthesis protein FlhB [Spirochaeta lutea]|uniref:flagellar biosynthesis protein FlhB n=1 Tax=Spirochaeta lutea TaxID=1480694 RepID=UPI000B05D458|nr:flagellar biosynthesis protein FlhB [Spirochaeta lutea]
MMVSLSARPCPANGIRPRISLEILNEDFFRAMDYQWFAAEDEGRTEDPTEHKKKKAREEGKVAKSPDVTSAIILIFAIITFSVAGQYFVNTMGEMVRYYLRLATEVDVVTDRVLDRAFISFFIRLVAPIALVCFVAALAGNLMQVGFLFTTKPLKPDFKRIAPNFVNFFKRALLSTEALYNLFKSIGKIIIIATIAILNIQGSFNKLLQLMKVSFMQSFQLIAQIAFSMVLQTAIVLLVLSLFDYLFQRKQHLDSLKMTKQEIKEERKTYEGDPLVKSRLRQRMREILSQNMMQQIPNADVVITNPTHYAIALEYKMDSMQAPMVTAKGVDTIAQRIKQLAFEHDVPVIENRPLARALHAEVDLGDVIPERYYEAVVAVFKEIYRMNKKKEAV